jgi:hypothetical protein
MFRCGPWAEMVEESARDNLQVRKVGD